MHSFAPDVLALLIAASGWYYLFYSRAAHKLDGLDSKPVNVWRILLRRVNGGVIMLLGVAVFVGSQNLPPVAFVAAWASAIGLLLLAVILAMIDIRLTWKMTQARRRGPRQ
jgi:hypothetical protein